MFRKKKPKRLYYPVKSSWYTKPRRKRVKRTRKRSFKVSFNFSSWFQKAPIVFFSVVGVVFISSLFLFSSYFRVADIEVVRTNFNIDSTAIESQLKSFVGQNLFFMSKSQVRQVIQQEFQEFQFITIKKIFPNKIQVQLEAYPVVANLKVYHRLPEVDEISDDSFDELNRAIEDLATDDPDLADVLTESPLEDETLSTGIFDIGGKEAPIEEDKADEIEQKGLLNEVGQILFDREENLELLTLSIRGLTQPVQDRDQVMESDHMVYLLNTQRYLLNQFDFNIQSIDYLPTARELHFTLDNGLSLWLTYERSYEEQIDKLKTIYDPAELSKIDLAYIDLRVREKVIYCPSGSACDRK